MAELLDIQPLEEPPVKTAPCEDCGEPATRTLAHWLKFSADIKAERAQGRSGAVWVKHLCPTCRDTEIATVNAENRKAIAAGDEPPHGGFTDLPLQEP